MSVGPISEAERLHAVDVVRGAAIFGILVVNMGYFFNPIYTDLLGFQHFEDDLERGVKLGIIGFAQGKFYTIFSLLFGFGLAIQLERFGGKGMSFRAFWVRRMLVLLAIGLIHALVIWFGDILVWYAICGLLLFFFRNAKAPTLKIWAVVLLLVPLLLMTVFSLFVIVRDEVTPDFEEQTAALESAMAEAQERYPVAGFSEILRLNLGQWLQLASFFVYMLPNVLGMFVIGLLFSRHRIFHDAASMLPRIRAALMWLIPLAVLCNGTNVLLYPQISLLVPSGMSILYQSVALIGQLSGCLSYIFLLLVAFHSPRMHRFVAPIGSVGRMALTNYLTHSIVFTTLANGYGAGLHGRVSLFAGLTLTLGIFVIQIAVSNAWLRRFRFGPMEWLWRSLTYLRLQPLRRAP